MLEIVRDVPKTRRRVCTQDEGETFAFKLYDDTNLVIPPIAFLSPTDADFTAVWVQGEESRILIGQKFPAFLELLNGTVFGSTAAADGTLSCVLVTPDDKQIAVKAFGTPAATVVQFKAPTLELLTLIDEFFRTLR
jgi:hypothetical protein